MHSKRGPGVAKIRCSGKLEVTTSNSPVTDRGESLSQKGVEAEGAHCYSPSKPEPFLSGFWTLRKRLSGFMEIGSKVFRAE